MADAPYCYVCGTNHAIKQPEQHSKSVYDRTDPYAMVKRLEDTNLQLTSEATKLRYNQDRVVEPK
jgi:hypothetical protein